MQAAIKNMSTKVIIGWIISLLIPICLILIPTSEAYTYEIKMFLAITGFCISCMVFDVLSPAYIGVFMPVFYVIFKVCSASVAFQSWSNHVVWMALGSFMFADMMMKSGFAKRIVYKMLSLTGGSYRGILFGIGFAGVLLTFIMSGRVHYLLAPLCYSLILALGLERSKASVGILLTSASIACDGNSFMYSNVVANLQEVGAAVTGDVSMPWLALIISRCFSMHL